MEQKYIFNIEDLFDKWEELMKEVERYCIQQGKDFFENKYDGALALAILYFYGLTKKEVLQIMLGDITENGIKGFDIIIDKKALSFLLKYQNASFYQKSHANGSPISVFYHQNTFIRTQSNQTIKVQAISDKLNASKYPPIDKIQKIIKMFSMRSLKITAKYDKLYQYGKLVGYNFVGEGKEHGKILNEHIDKLQEILDIEYNPQERNSFLAHFRKYARNYYYDRVKWEENREQSENSIEEIIDKQPSEPAQSNQDLLINKLLGGISSIETELQDLKDLVALLKRTGE